MTLFKDILVVTPTPSHPQDSGNRKRIYTLFKHLQANSFKIHYVLYNVYNKSFCNKSNYEAMREEWDYFDYVLHSHDNCRFVANIKRKILQSCHYSNISLKGAYLPIQYGIDDWCSDALTKFINWKCSNFPISTVFVEYVFLSKVLKGLPENTFKVIDTHDVFANRHSSLIKNNIKPNFFTTPIKEEVKGLNRADLVLAIQKEEKKYFEERINSEVIELAHLEEEKFVSRKYNFLDSIGIIASSNPINVSSVQNFLDLLAEVKSLSSLKFYIAGAVSQKISCSLPNVVVLGQVDCLEHFYNMADLYLNLMIAGTGIKIKTIEAFSYGVPLLSTKFGSDGSGSKFEFHNFPSLKELVDHINNLYSNQASLKTYQEASKSCFHTYRANLNIQLDSLLARLKR